MQSTLAKTGRQRELHHQQHQQQQQQMDSNSKPSVGKLDIEKLHIFSTPAAGVTLAKERRVSDTVMRSERRPAPVTAPKSRRISAWTGPSSSSSVLMTQQLSEELNSHLHLQQALRQCSLSDQLPTKTASLDRLPVTTLPVGGLLHQSHGTSTNTSTSSNGDVRWKQSGDTLGSTAELAVSFDQEMMPAQLSCHKKVKGMAGRRQPEPRSYNTEL